jgi:hypothetical protein
MIDRVKLRENYKEETGEHWKMICSTAQPTVQYTKWLEDKLVKNCSIPDVVGQGEQFVCVCSKTGYYIEDGVRLCDNCNAPHYTN